jgi:single-strand DNA-binding protein
VLVEGRLVADSGTGSPRIWNRQDGTPGASFEISATTVQFLDSRRDEEGGEGSAGSHVSEPDDNIPF